VKCISFLRSKIKKQNIRNIKGTEGLQCITGRQRDTKFLETMCTHTAVGLTKCKKSVREVYFT